MDLKTVDESCYFELTIDALGSGAPIGIIVDGKKIPWVSPYGLRTVRDVLLCLEGLCLTRSIPASYTAAQAHLGAKQHLTLFAYTVEVYTGDGFDGAWTLDIFRKGLR